MTVSASNLSLVTAFQVGNVPVVRSQTTPRGFKSVVQSTIDFLLAHELSATLWAKLPKELAWWEDIQRYRSAQTTSKLYCLGAHGLSETRSTPCAEQVTPIPAGIRGEYFLLIVADGFVYTLVARRQMAQRQIAQRQEATEGKPELFMQGALDLQVAQSLKVILRQIVEFANADGNFTEMLSLWDVAVPLPHHRIDALHWADAFLNWQLQAQTRAFQEIAQSRKQNTLEATQANALEPSVTTAAQMDSPLSGMAQNLIQNAEQELRTPLTTIKTALTLLNSPMIKPGQRQRYLDMISSECDRQSTLINRVFELLQLHNRSRVAELQPLNLADLVPGIVSTYQPLAQERDIMLAYTIPSDLPLVGGVESWLKQVLINLLSNSIQFTENGGRVWVTAKPESDQFIALRVKDTGLGITATELPVIFDAFYQGTAAVAQGVRGAGLGLTLTRQLLAQSEGSLSVDSTPAEGTLVKVLLPVWQEP
ncbi:MAG: ATP-binding protein [Cyanobacteria bacterium J06635_1]